MDAAGTAEADHTTTGPRPPGREPPAHPERLAGGRRVRVVREAGGGRGWRVWVVDARHVPGAQGDRCLIFDSGTCLRRVWTIPDDWESMPPEALLALTAHARAAAPGADAAGPDAPGATRVHREPTASPP